MEKPGNPDYSRFNLVTSIFGLAKDLVLDNLDAEKSLFAQIPREVDPLDPQQYFFSTESSSLSKEVQELFEIEPNKEMFVFYFPTVLTESEDERCEEIILTLPTTAEMLRYHIFRIQFFNASKVAMHRSAVPRTRESGVIRQVFLPDVSLNDMEGVLQLLRVIKEMQRRESP